MKVIAAKKHVLGYYCDEFDAICLSGECGVAPKIQGFSSRCEQIDVTSMYSNTVGCRPGPVTHKLSLSDGRDIYPELKIFGDNHISIQREFNANQYDAFQKAVEKETLRFLDTSRRLMPLDIIPTSECNCGSCKKFCTEQLCFATPDEIINLIDRGYANRLMLAYGYDDTILIVPAIQGYEGKAAPYPAEGSCTFFKDGKCEINQLKPIKGRLYTHRYDVDSIYYSDEKISELWGTKRADNLVNLWEDLVGCDTYPDSDPDKYPDWW